VILVVSKTFPMLRSIVRRFPLRHLATEIQRAPPLATLFIRPLSNRPIQDEALLKKMLSRDGQAAEAPPSRPGRPVVGPQPPKRR
jgi:hypothetical protein